MSSALHAHWTLDPEIVFLNHGSFGATPKAVLEHQSELRAQLERQPLRFFLREYPELWDEACRRGAEFVGADLDGFTYVNNASTGVSTVLRSLEFRPGDELVVSNHEYRACRNALDFVAERSGATVRVVELPLPVDGPEPIVQAVEHALTERTKLVLIDHVTSQTGIVIPVEDIIAACHERGIEVLVDGAHAPGMIDLSIRDLAADYYTGNFHKWVCTPKAAAFLWVKPERHADIRPLVISHGATMAADSATDRFRNEFWWQGTFDPTAVFSIPFGIDHMASLVEGGWDQIRRHNHELAVEGRAILNDALGQGPLVPDEMLGSTATVRLPDGKVKPDSPFDPDPDQRALLDDWNIEVPVTPFPSFPKRLLRISAQLYNSTDDYERLAEALDHILT